jgi:hypothetical protein
VVVEKNAKATKARFIELRFLFSMLLLPTSIVPAQDKAPLQTSHEGYFLMIHIFRARKNGLFEPLEGVSEPRFRI